MSLTARISVQTAKVNIESSISGLGHDNAAYDLCAKVLDEVKQVILNLVKMLEVADKTFVKNLQERVKRCTDTLREPSPPALPH